MKTIAIAMRPKSSGVRSRARTVSDTKSSAFAPIRATTKAPLAVAVRCETADLPDTLVLGILDACSAAISRQTVPSTRQNRGPDQYNHGRNMDERPVCRVID